jgi:hypothetical protein
MVLRLILSMPAANMSYEKVGNGIRYQVSRYLLMNLLVII